MSIFRMSSRKEREEEPGSDATKSSTVVAATLSPAPLDWMEHSSDEQPAEKLTVPVVLDTACRGSTLWCMN